MAEGPEEDLAQTPKGPWVPLAASKAVLSCSKGPSPAPGRRRPYIQDKWGLTAVCRAAHATYGPRTKGRYRRPTPLRQSATMAPRAPAFTPSVRRVLLPQIPPMPSYSRGSARVLPRLSAMAILRRCQSRSWQNVRLFAATRRSQTGPCVTRGGGGRGGEGTRGLRPGDGPPGQWGGGGGRGTGAAAEEDGGQ